MKLPSNEVLKENGVQILELAAGSMLYAFTEPKLADAINKMGAKDDQSDVSQEQSFLSKAKKYVVPSAACLLSLSASAFTSDKHAKNVLNGVGTAAAASIIGKLAADSGNETLKKTAEKAGLSGAVDYDDPYLVPDLDILSVSEVPESSYSMESKNNSELYRKTPIAA